jgi:hypothetical protein
MDRNFTTRDAEVADCILVMLVEEALHPINKAQWHRHKTTKFRSQLFEKNLEWRELHRIRGNLPTIVNRLVAAGRCQLRFDDFFLHNVEYLEPTKPGTDFIRRGGTIVSVVPPELRKLLVLFHDYEDNHATNDFSK